MNFARKKTIFLCTQMEAGGVQVRATSMCASLNARGMDVEVVFIYKKRSPFPENPNHRVILPHPPRNLWDSLSSIVRVIAYVVSQKPKSVVGFAHFSSPIAAIAGLVAGAPIRIGTQTNPASSVPIIGRLLDFICGSTGIYTANIAVSDTVKATFENYPQIYKSRMKVIHNGAHFSPTAMSKSECRAHFGFGDGDILLVNCGRLSYQKNQEFLLEVIKEMPSVKLVILGDGELRAALEAKTKELGLTDRVVLIGERPREEVPLFLKAGDVFVFPSRFEAFGLALAEAMASGLPIVSSDFDASREVLGDAGYRIALSDRSEWKIAINRILTDQAFRDAMSEEVKIQASKFTYDSMLSGYLAEIS